MLWLLLHTLQLCRHLLVTAVPRGPTPRPDVIGNFLSVLQAAVEGAAGPEGGAGEAGGRQPEALSGEGAADVQTAPPRLMSQHAPARHAAGAGAQMIWSHDAHRDSRFGCLKQFTRSHDLGPLQLPVARLWCPPEGSRQQNIQTGSSVNKLCEASDWRGRGHVDLPPTF